MWGMVPQLAVGRTPNAAPPKERMWGITCLPCSKEGEDLPDEGTWYCCCHPECNFQCTFRKNVKTTIYSHLLTHGVEKDTSKGRGKAVVDRQQPPASRSTSSVASMPATQDPASASQERPAGGVPQAGSSNPPPPLSQPGRLQVGPGKHLRWSRQLAVSLVSCDRWTRRRRATRE
jgi:hypothetical protein